MITSINNDNNSMSTLNSKNKKSCYKDSIPMRIEFIKNLLDGKDLNTLVNFDITDTDNFIGRDEDMDSGDSYDTRIILKKRIFLRLSLLLNTLKEFQIHSITNYFSY